MPQAKKRTAPKPKLETGNIVNDFIVSSVTQLHDTRMTAYRLEHVRTGARLLHLDADDDENLFSIAIPTPPPDNTGVPHIIEHCVLSGSKKYPVRDPFFEMARMSMATFINAMTGPDCTYYPVASNVEKDLFNLAEVYFDAVFHPYPEYSVLLLAYHCRVEKGILKPIECHDLRWVNLGELQRLAMPPADEPIRKHLCSSDIVQGT